ncbi:hypothetical protein BOTBODRAFT_48491 [Botryobasidium botryosum FD-172 SS1]|uniref:Uncharacterized protein n=1 Tax=Botryobasidium botryosum (strain FD-172 SS1) TaxID=930990 RepID=A0A067LXK2_BOTB1|nr:hypothetical protein BOTBODRAFT_48491 [Botryobasidium botryosum FD-172 SS1]
MSTRRQYSAGLPSSVAPRRAAQPSPTPPASYASLPRTPSSYRQPHASATPSSSQGLRGDGGGAPARRSLASSRGSALPATPRPSSRAPREERDDSSISAQTRSEHRISYQLYDPGAVPPSRKGSEISTHSYTSSASSSGDSIFDRASKFSGSSSRSSLVDEEIIIKDVTTTSTLSVQAIAPPAARSRESVGTTWWNRVTAAAGNITQTVSKAWERQDDGDYQEPESHLEDVLKKYYIDRARAPSDLPAWLFHELERHPERVFKRHSVEEEALKPAGGNGGSGSGPARDSPTSTSTRSPSSSAPSLKTDGTPARPVNRLKEIREAKRRAQQAQAQAQAVQLAAPTESASTKNDQPRYQQARAQGAPAVSFPRERIPASAADYSDVGRSMRPRQPVGLPAGPGRAGRRV